MSKSGGLLAPRMTAAQRNAISNPAKGLIIFCTDNNSLYTNTGTSASPLWQTITSPWSSSGADIYYNLGKVGIGAPALSKPLEVAGTGGIQISNGSYASANNELFFSDNGQIRSLDDHHRIVFNRSSDQLEFNELGRILFKTGNPITEVMRITNTGNVGIGTDAPAAKLDVNGAAKINGSVNIAGNVGIGTPISSKPLEVAVAGGIQITNGFYASPNNELYFSDNGQIRSYDNNHRIVFNRSGNQLEFREFGNIIFYTGSPALEILRLTNNNVGIGAFYPDESAVLELRSLSKGFLPPRMTQSQRDLISSPAEGLVIYNYTTKKPNYYDGLNWMNYDGTFAN